MIISKITCPHPYLCVHPPFAQRGSWNTITICICHCICFCICPPFPQRNTIPVIRWGSDQFSKYYLENSESLKDPKHLFPYFYKLNSKYSIDFANMWKGSQEKTNHCPDIFVNWKNMWITHPSMPPLSSKDWKYTNIQIFREVF